MLGGIPAGMQSPAPTGAPAGADPLPPALDHPPVTAARGGRWYPAGKDVQTPKTTKPSIKHLIPHPHPKPGHGTLENLPEIKSSSLRGPPKFGGCAVYLPQSWGAGTSEGFFFAHSKAVL